MAIGRSLPGKLERPITRPSLGTCSVAGNCLDRLGGRPVMNGGPIGHATRALSSEADSCAGKVKDPAALEIRLLMTFVEMNGRFTNRVAGPRVDASAALSR